MKLTDEDRENIARAVAWAIHCRDFWGGQCYGELETAQIQLIVEMAKYTRKRFGVPGLNLFLNGMGYDFIGSAEKKLTTLRFTLDDLATARFKARQIEELCGVR